MKTKHLFQCVATVALFLLFALPAFSQELTMKGKITDNAGEPLAGASVMVKGTTVGTITDLDGNYVLSGLSKGETLVYSFIGFDDYEVTVENDATLNVALKQSTQLLDEVMVVGYAQGSKRTISGAIEKVKSEDMNTGIVNNALDAVKGKVAGLVISSTGGDPMGTPNVRIRGTSSLSGGNEPLVIVDGVFGDMDLLNAISPNDIADVTVLKDASETAQYGSRGAAGVLVVTTNRGKAGRTDIQYDGTFGIGTVYKNLDMLSSSEYRQLAKNLGVNFTDFGSDTDWADVVERDYSINQRHNLSFTSGNENANMRASLGYIQDQGILRRSDMKNYTMKFDASQYAFNKKLKLDLGAFASERDGKPIYDMNHLFRSIASVNPTISPNRNAKGTYDYDPAASDTYNPAGQLEIDNKLNAKSLNAHGRITWYILDGLNLTAFGSYTNMTFESKRYIPASIEQGRSDRGRATIANRSRKNFLGNIQLNYTQDFGKHHIDALALVEGQKYSSFNYSMSETGFDTDYFGYNNMKAGAVVQYGYNNSGSSEYVLSSYMARVNYVYDDRYIVTLNARADGSSKLGEDNKWGFFPSASAAWNVVNEKFMKDLHWVNNLKIRAGYGVTGNQDAIEPYNSLSLMSPNGTTSYNNNATTTYAIASNSNPDLKWEMKYTFDVGLDFTGFDNRLNLTMDYYRSTTKDLLYTYTVPVPPFVYSTLLANIGEMTNNGLEIALSGDVVKTKDFVFNMGGNMSFQKNELVSLTGTYKGETLTPSEHIELAVVHSPGLSQNNGVTYLMEGQPVGVFYIPHCTGISEDGQYIMEDLNGDGKIDLSASGDRYVAGQAIPKVNANFNLNFKYKNWGLTANFNGAFGHKIYNGTSSVYSNLSQFPTFNVIDGAAEKGIHDIQISDYWLEKGDYVHFDYLTLNYTFGKKALDKIGFVKSLRLGLSVNNIATITGYSGLSPMINSANIAVSSEGTLTWGTIGVDDKRTYPLTRTFSFSIAASF